MALELKGVGRKFLRGGREIWAVRDVNLTVAQGAFLYVIGRSGSGKSTLLNLISGLLEPTSGEILLDGKSILGLSDKEASLLRNEKIGYVLQGYGDLSNLTVWENVSLPFYLYPHAGDGEARAEKLLEQVGLTGHRRAYPAQLSGGERKRLAIARALINQPQILLADEPTGDLDEENTERILQLFRTIADQGTTVIAVTHELDTLKYGDAVFQMEAGALQARRLE